MPFSFRFTMPLPNGLHARPSTVLREHARSHGLDATIANLRSNRQAKLTDVMALVSLDARQGDTCEVVVAGPDAERLGAAFEQWLATDFPHCDDALPQAAPAANRLGSVIPRLLEADQTKHWFGTGVSDGIGEGALVAFGGGLPASLPAFDRGNESQAQAVFSTARERIESELAEAIRTASGTERGVLEAHAAMLDDSSWQTRVSAAISAGAHAAQAVLAIGLADAAQLAASDNPYLAARAADVRDLARRLLLVLPGGITAVAAPRLTAPSIVVADDISPSDFLALDRSFLKGVVLKHGAATGHTSILARSFAVPCVVGAVVEANPGTPLLIDGRRGLVAASPTGAVARYYALERNGAARRRARLNSETSSAAATADGKAIAIEANLAGAEEAAGAVKGGAEGVGLFRTEMLFLGHDTPPSEDQQYETYRTVAEAFGKHPVTIRLIDIGGDKQIAWLPLPKEENPFLGVRGVRLYAQHAGLISTQLRAILRAAVHGNIRIMIPMVAEQAEVVLVRRMVAEAAEELRTAGLPHRADVPVGIMVEVPAAVMHLDVLGRVSDFFCVGTNDLAQYIFAADRGNPAVSKAENDAHPAFLRVLRKIATDGHAAGRTVAICGELAGRVKLLPLLVGLGIDELSMSPPRVAEAKSALAGLDAARCAELASACCDLDDAAAVFAHLDKHSVSTIKAPLIEPELVVLDCDATSKEEAIKAMIETLHVAGRTVDPQGVEEAIWKREGVYSTGIGHGFAIPHCQSDALAASAVVVARFRNPLEWKSLDGEPVHIAAMLAIRPAEGADAHMRVFAKLARKLMNDEFRDALRDAATPDAVVQVFTENVLS